MGKSTISMAIFNSYVKLPEGTPLKNMKVLWLRQLGYSQYMENHKKYKNHVPNQQPGWDMIPEEFAVTPSMPNTWIC